LVAVLDDAVGIVVVGRTVKSYRSFDAVNGRSRLGPVGNFNGSLNGSSFSLPEPRRRGGAIPTGGSFRVPAAGSSNGSLNESRRLEAARDDAAPRSNAPWSPLVAGWRGKAALPREGALSGDGPTARALASASSVEGSRLATGFPLKSLAAVVGGKSSTALASPPRPCAAADDGLSVGSVGPPSPSPSPARFFLSFGGTTGLSM
jgi:hypothetical protein